ncbi:hypothetical protein [Herbaspirillum camelliae]|uniref:hypothetical protein n=1 Tax=Herbaspirillum camelliae TaxID=1892903 RepID=UPI000949F454|nr:hypothetical protein [Herbaspirillum camelliae]
MKHFARSVQEHQAGHFMPRVAKLDKHKYAAYIDTRIDHLWSMDLHGQPVRICKKRKLAEKAALDLLAEAMRQYEGQPQEQ